VDCNAIADSNAAQWPKESIAMRREYRIPTLPRQSRAREMPCAALEDVLIVAFEYHGRKMQPGNL
jgi:hypothetical protein